MRYVRNAIASTQKLVGNVALVVRMLWQEHRRAMALVCLALLADAASAIAIAYIGKRLVEAALDSVRTPGAGPRRLLVLVGVELGLVLVRTLAAEYTAYAQVVLRSALRLRASLAVLETAAGSPYSSFEDPSFLNRLRLAREATAHAQETVNQLVSVLRSVLTLAGLVTLIATLGPLPAVALLVGALPPFFVEARFGREQFAMQSARAARHRRAGYLEYLLCDTQVVKEVKALGLGRWLTQRFRKVHTGFHDEETRLAERRAGAVFASSALSAIIFTGALASVVAATAAGRFTVGDMAMYFLVVRQVQVSIQGTLRALARLYEDNLRLSHLFEFVEDRDEEAPSVEYPARADSTPPRIRFERVSFRYPDAPGDTLEAIDFAIEPGETVALVGPNGAGKTTLVKLLLGLHRPSSGRVLIDDRDIALMDPAELRALIAVTFQDFARFHFTVKENVGLGSLASMDDTAEIVRALTESGARPDVERLPEGVDTLLGRTFGGGVDLSVGQWQRLALARTLMRKSKIVVLDEPTAALDAQAEHEVYQRFAELTRDRTALLITHRLSSVRLADRILVLDGGRLAEEGAHDDLMRKGGLYAEMYSIQANSYYLDARAMADRSGGDSAVRP